MFSTLGSALRTLERSVGIGPDFIEPYNGNGAWLHTANERFEVILSKYEESPQIVNTLKIVKEVVPLFVVLSKFKNPDQYAADFIGREIVIGAIMANRTGISDRNLREIVQNYIPGIALFYNDFKVSNNNALKIPFRSYPIANSRLQFLSIYDAMLEFLTQFTSRVFANVRDTAATSRELAQLRIPFAGLYAALHRVETEALEYATMNAAPSMRNTTAPAQSQTNLYKRQTNANFRTSLSSVNIEPSLPPRPLMESIEQVRPMYHPTIFTMFNPLPSPPSTLPRTRINNLVLEEPRVTPASTIHAEVGPNTGFYNATGGTKRRRTRKVRKTSKARRCGSKK